MVLTPFARNLSSEFANKIAALSIFNQAARASFCDVTGGVWPRPLAFYFSSDVTSQKEARAAWLKMGNIGELKFRARKVIGPRKSVIIPDKSRAQTPPPRGGEGLVFLVVLSQHVRKTGNPIRLLDLLQSCDMKEN